MSNGPEAVISETVLVDIPRPRVRTEIIKDEGYYKLRNYLVDFLVNRSDERPDKTESGLPQEVNPIKKKSHLEAIKDSKLTA